MAPPGSVFISHDTDDATAALLLKSFLEGAFPGTKVFVAAVDLRGGDVWAETLRARLASSAAIITLLTSRSVKSPWVAFESGAGFLGRKSIPLVADGLTMQDIPAPFKILQARLFDMDGIRALADDLARRLSLTASIPIEAIAGLLRDVTRFFERRRQSGAEQAPAETAKWDLELTAALNSLASKSKRALLARFETVKRTTPLPPAEELAEMDLAHLFILASNADVEAPFLSTFGLYELALDPPLASDPIWKKENVRRRIAEGEKELKEFENVTEKQRRRVRLTTRSSRLGGLVRILRRMARKGEVE